MFKSTLNSLSTQTIHFFNQPTIKEGIKNITSTVTFIFGMFEIYDLYQRSSQKVFSSKWEQALTTCAKISLIFSAAVSRPGIFVIGTFVNLIFSRSRLERIFGVSTIFAINPWHPRHVLSIAAAAISLPSVIGWIYHSAQKKEDSWTSNRSIHWMTMYNFVTSRPTQHLGNHLCRAVVKIS